MKHIRNVALVWPWFRKEFTLVKAVLLLLALGSAASSVVELVADAAEKAALALLLGAGGLGLVLVVVDVAAAGKVLDEIHCW